MRTSAVALPVLASVAQASLNCDSYCSGKFGKTSAGYVMGTAPFCSGDCYDCHDGDFCGPLNGDFVDGGHTCATGSKQCCCTQPRGMELQMEETVAAPSCDSFCSSKGIKYGYVRGTAPFCGAGPNDCCAHDYPGMQASSFSDGGASCATGSKQCCCGTPVGQSSCPKPGPSDLSCNIVNGVCKLIANKAISSVAECTEVAAEGAVLCETVGLGPEDPWADACAVVIAGAIETACTQAIKQGGKFAATQCTKAAGCAVSSELAGQIETIETVNQCAGSQKMCRDYSPHPTKQPLGGMGYPMGACGGSCPGGTHKEWCDDNPCVDGGGSGCWFCISYTATPGLNTSAAGLSMVV